MARFSPLVFRELVELERELDRPAAAEGPGAAWSCRWLNAGDAARLRAFHARTGVAASYLDQALRRKDLAAGCFWNGRLVGWIWAHRDPGFPLRVFHCPLNERLEPGQAYVHHFYVLPEFRARSLQKENACRLLLRWFYAELARAGVTRLKTFIFAENELSLRIHLKLGSWRVRRSLYVLGVAGIKGWTLDAAGPVRRVLGWAGAVKRHLRENALTRAGQSLFPEAWLLEGESTDKGEKSRALVFGHADASRYWALRAFGRLPRYRSLGRVPLWRWPQHMRTHRPAFLLAQMPASWARRRARRQGFCLPEFLDAAVPTPARDSDGILRGPDILRKTRHLIEKNGWSFRITRDLDEFYRFYHFDYLPSANRKFSHHRYILPVRAMRRLFQSGFLLQVMDQGRHLAGLLVVEKPKAIWLAYSGVRRGSSRLADRGVQAAAYYFSVMHAAQTGLETVDFGRCRPFFQDGVFSHKRRWGVRLRFNAGTSRCYWLLPDMSQGPAVEFLRQNPFIALSGRGLEGRFFYDPPCREKAAAIEAREKALGVPGVPSRHRPLPRTEGRPTPARAQARSLWPLVARAGLRLYGRWEYRSPAGNYLDLYRRTPWMPPQDLRKFQGEKLARLLDHARRTVPYFQHPRFVPATKDSPWDQWRRMPVMDRAAMALDPDRYRSAARFPVVTRVSTSGTTGHPVCVWVDGASIKKREAVRWRGREWWGLERGDPHAKFWGRFHPPSWRRWLKEERLENAELFNAYRWTPATSEQCYRSLRTKGRRYFYGYAGLTFAVARDWLERGWSIPSGRLEAVIVTADEISESQRGVIEQVFGAPAVVEYGSTEFHQMAMECPQGGLHMDADRLLVEFLDSGGRPARPFEPAQIVVTDLDNLAMPLIRYPIGDLGSFSNRPCVCGRTLPLLHELRGRENAFLELPGGGKAHSAVLSQIVEEAMAAAGMPPVAWQAVQRTADEIEIFLAANRPSPVLEAAVQAKVAALDSRLRAVFRYDSAIPWSLQGKRARFVNQIPDRPALLEIRARGELSPVSGS
jgi:phenylacetate-CoA ligase